MEELRKKDFSEEIDLKKFFLFLKKNLKNIAVLTLSGTILFGVYSFLIPDIYKSSAILKVNSDSSSNSSNLRAIDNFASVIGISNSSSSEVLKSDLAVETLKAKSFIKHISLKIILKKFLLQNLLILRTIKLFIKIMFLMKMIIFSLMIYT